MNYLLQQIMLFCYRYDYCQSIIDVPRTRLDLEVGEIVFVLQCGAEKNLFYEQISHKSTVTLQYSIVKFYLFIIHKSKIHDLV